MGARCLHHLAHAVGEGDGDGEREALGDSHDDDGYGVEEVVEDLRPLDPGCREPLDLYHRGPTGNEAAAGAMSCF